MYERGYEATSTIAIATAAGVSPATLFNYFPTKASIVFADDHLWAPPPTPVAAGSNVRATLGNMMLTLMEQPEWTRPAEDELTRMRFALVRSEPILTREQTSRAFALVPQFASAVRTLHPDVDERTALVETGAVIGAMLATLLWSDTFDVRQNIQIALSTLNDAE